MSEHEEEYLARARKAASFMESYVRSHHEQLKGTFRETAPGAGYGRYIGHDTVREIGTFLFHFTDEHFLNIKFPENYPSPQALSERLAMYVSHLQSDLARLDKIFERFKSQGDHIPDNASGLYVATREYKQAAEQTLKLMSGKLSTTSMTSNTPSPPNWANKTSAIIASIMLVGSVVAAFSALLYDHNNLKGRVELLEKKLQAPAPISGDEASMRKDVCVRLIGAYTDARDNLNSDSIRAYEAMLQRAGCTTS